MCINVNDFVYVQCAKGMRALLYGDMNFIYIAHVDIHTLRVQISQRMYTYGVSKIGCKPSCMRV
jgi:hypothetical protein